ncbi:MAG TPA: N-acetyl-D-Glu racemase DgcA [Alphaproteobacteria bacterium]|nr:N-acetyl-D-Glu racemase DgcA [Alphaproteobacteria bacterium]
MSRTLTVRPKTWPTRGTWTISRGSSTSVDVVIVEIEQDGRRGLGECRPYGRYGESVGSVVAQIENLRDAIQGGMTRQELQPVLAPGAARHAIDCALWDLEAKLAGKPVWQLAGLKPPQPVTTAFTISLGSVEEMGAKAREAAHQPLLKLKLTGEGDLERVRAVRANAPDSRLVVDANEAWTMNHLRDFGMAFVELGVEMIEQPLPADRDQDLIGFDCPITLCADESCHDTASLDHLRGKYSMINIKLDKTGGLTEALALRDQARAAGFKIMAGCMLASSLAMAPALLIAQDAEVVDLDGPLLLAEDHSPALRFEGARILPPGPELWG